MKSAEIRERFQEFYEGKGHTRVPSASLVPSSYDPSVLLTTAGMQPFKPYFLGQATPPASRLTSCQKCFRTPDIDEVGLTARHLTFFEMLGNFSFGDYFKQGAVEMAWEFVTKVIGLDSELLWATVHAGDEKLGLGIDQEAVDLWLAQGLPRERIVALGEDNFWKAGPTGPCGPCSEIYYDRGEAFGCGRDVCAPGCECDRYLEFYNLVFMQFDRDASGKLTPLPKQNIDTGMGLERLSSLLQGNVSVFEIDTFREIIGWAERLGGVTYGDDAATTKALRILADHGRGMTMLASDGVMPSNEGRGYVLRRIIRRAIQQAERIGLYKGRYEYEGPDGLRGGVLAGLSDVVVRLFGDVYPELVQQRTAVVEILNAEEERFLATLSQGSGMLQQVIDAARQDKDKDTAGAISGDDAFKLHDTYGFPVELTTELAEEAGLSVDLERFTQLMGEQRERARAAGGGGSVPADVVAAFARKAPASIFVGFGTLETQTSVLAAEPVEADGIEGNALLVKVGESPFYAEGGGQVGDIGVVQGERGRGTVHKVMRFEDDQVLLVEIDGELVAGDAVTAAVDPAHRLPTQRNHTATHLLHKALRDRFGDHVRQAGSLVAPDRLRFDFSHSHALTRDDLAAIEREVNEHISAGEHVGWTELDIDAAREAGAMMLFGEKYGDVVRMVQVGDGYSRELCGGTHVTDTSHIQLFLVSHESSVGANTRRIEALTGDAAVQHLRDRASVAERAAAAANVDVDKLPARVEELVKRGRQLERELSSLKSGADIDTALEAAEAVDGVHVVVYRSDALTGDELLELSDRLKQKLDPAAVLVGGAQDDKVTLIANVSDAALARGANANDLIRAISSIVGGGGGGRPTMARAGGKDPSRLDEALEAGRASLHTSLGGNGA